MKQAGIDVADAPGALADADLGALGSSYEEALLRRLTDLDLDHRLEPPLAQHAAEAAWHDDRDLLPELFE